MEKNDEEQYLSSFNSSNNLILSDLDIEQLKNHFKTTKFRIKKELDSINFKVNKIDLDQEIINTLINEYLSKKI